MKKYLALILLISLSCSTKKEDEEILYRDQISSLKIQINKPEKYPVYFYYRDFTVRDNKVFIDSTFNKDIVIDKLFLLNKKQVYDIRKIDLTSWYSKQSNQEIITTSMEIIFKR